MRSSFLLTLASTLAFSIGLVQAGAGPSTESKPEQRTLPIYDAMGVISNNIICNKNVYSKREAYAAVREAYTLKKENKYAIAGCESFKFCTRYPKRLMDDTLGFKMQGPYEIFPILPNKKLYKGGRLPVSDLVVFDSRWEVAGIIRATAKGYTKCLLDDNYTPKPQGFLPRLNYKYRYWTGTK